MPYRFKENKTAELETKMAQLNSKLMEYRNQVETQKKELKIAHKVFSIKKTWNTQLHLTIIWFNASANLILR